MLQDQHESTRWCEVSTRWCCTEIGTRWCLSSLSFFAADPSSCSLFLFVAATSSFAAARSYSCTRLASLQHVGGHAFAHAHQDTARNNTHTNNTHGTHVTHATPTFRSFCPGVPPGGLPMFWRCLCVMCCRGTRPGPPPSTFK